jgi:starch synthase
LRILYAAAEVAGFAKTGGLADVAAALPRALARRGLEGAVVLPLYRCVRQGPRPLTPTGLTLRVPIGGREVSGALWRSTLAGSDVPVYLVEQPDHFERDDPARGAGIYQFTDAGGGRRDYADNCERFAFFGRAILEAPRLLGWWPDVLHLNEWHTALVPVYLREVYRTQDPAYRRLRTLFTIHNMGYQGIFSADDFGRTGLPWRLFNFEQLEYYGHLNCLKAGILFADRLSAVSPTYAREIQILPYGHGLQSLLAARRDRLAGILNGVDYGAWDPSSDPFLPRTYDRTTVVPGKAAAKQALQRRLGLPEQPHATVLGMIARLVEQKGMDLLGEALPALLRQDVQVVVLGEGDPRYHEMLSDLQARFPERLGLRLAQDEVLAHLIQAGADVFLMPSLFEPCGLVQLYALRYGTVPVVRATGGLADTVVNATPETLAAGTATGFTFGPPLARLFLEAVERALSLYRQRPEEWLALMRVGMAQDWSWNRSAAEYEWVYEDVTTRPVNAARC